MSRIFLLVFLLLFVSTFGVSSQDEVKEERGKASYYSNKFRNKKTASGYRYDPAHYVCAHRSYPFGTKLLVRNIKKGKEIVVEVVDRGPFKKSRIVDVSYAAAVELDIINSGIETVEISEYTNKDSIVITRPEIYK